MAPVTRDQLLRFLQAQRLGVVASGEIAELPPRICIGPEGGRSGTAQRVYTLSTQRRVGRGFDQVPGLAFSFWTASGSAKIESATSSYVTDVTVAM